MTEDPSRPPFVLTTSDRLALISLTGVSVFMAWALWCKLETLVHLDPSWWLQEISRAAQGQLPYRDFGWHFPPLAVMLYGFALSVFGIRFSVVQTVMDVLSLGIVVLIYFLSRHFVPRLLQWLTGLLLIAVCCTTMTYFSLFSLLGYSLAFQTGALGLLLLLNGAMGYIDDRRWTVGRIVLVTCGSFVALLSKPESIVAAATILALLVVFGRAPGSVTRVFLLLAGCVVPALAVYAFFIHAAGLATVAASISGYGLATRTCPWWPTGIGIWAALAGLGAACLLVALGSSVDAPAWRQYLGEKKYALMWLSATVGSICYAIYELYVHASFLFHSGGWTSARLLSLLQGMAGTTDVFRSALWPAILLFAFLVLRGLRHRLRLPNADFKLLIVLAGPAAMSFRSLFSTVLTPFPEVPAMCYPFVILLGPHLLYRALSAPGGDSAKRNAIRFTTAATVLYIAIRIAGGYPEVLSSRNYTSLATNAGRIRVADGGTSREIYEYVVANTKPGDGLLELPYGGGIGFAAGRRSPAYSTLFVQLSPPESVQKRDLEEMQRHPPALVISRDEPHLGTYYGVDLLVGCEFPSLVWASGKRAGDPDIVLPIVRYIRSNYHVERKIDGWQILGLNALSPAGTRSGASH